MTLQGPQFWNTPESKIKGDDPFDSPMLKQQSMQWAMQNSENDRVELLEGIASCVSTSFYKREKADLGLLANEDLSRDAWAIII